MSQYDLLRDCADGAVGAAFWTCLAWPAVMATFWPWWQSQWGLNMVIKTELIAAALLSSVLKVEFGITSGLILLWVTVCAVSAIPLVIAWRSVLIWRGQRAGAARDRDGSVPPAG